MTLPVRPGRRADSRLLRLASRQVSSLGLDAIYPLFMKRSLNQAYIVLSRDSAAMLCSPSRGNRQALRFVPRWGLLAVRPPRKPTMPRYFFHFCEGNSKNFVRDSEGAIFSGIRKAKKEAVDLAQDIAGLRVDRSTWQVLVTDENGEQVFRMPLCEVRARKFRLLINLAHRIGTYESGFRPEIFTYLLVAGVLAMIAQTAMLTPWMREISRSTYHLASAEMEGTTISVRFVPRTSIAEIEKFMQTYEASLFTGPLPGGWYRLRISGSIASLEELTQITSKMRQEAIVSFAVVDHVEDG